jgi:hypothetical protein
MAFPKPLFWFTIRPLNFEWLELLIREADLQFRNRNSSSCWFTTPLEADLPFYTRVDHQKNIIKEYHVDNLDIIGKLLVS